MTGRAQPEGPWLFDSKRVLAALAAAPAARRKLAELARRKEKLDREQEDACARMAEATRPLADLIVAACGRSAYQVADAVLDTIAAREDPAGYGRKVGRRPQARPPGLDVRSTRLYSDLRVDAHRLRPVFRDLRARQEALLRKLADLVAPDDRERYRRWVSTKGRPEGDLWLQLLYGALSSVDEG